MIRPFSVAKATRSLIVYCDESDAKGKYYSNFYGGVAIDARNQLNINRSLDDCRNSLPIQGEVKWTKIGDRDYHQYICLMDAFFDLVEARKAKVRIMFIQNRFVAKALEQYHVDNEYFLLYHQFIKHAFGLRYCNPQDGKKVRVQLLLDALPDNDERCDNFKDYMASLSFFPPFRDSGVFIERDDITEIESHRHIIAQCLDVVLGAMQFRLNDKHSVKPPGAWRRGKRTIAKEKVYKHINKRLGRIRPHFNIGITTGKETREDYWKHSYRHWSFVPTSSIIDNRRTKKK